MDYRDVKGGIVTEAQLMMSAGEDGRTLQIMDTRSNIAVLRVHLTHDQFGRMTANQTITTPVQLFSGEGRHGKYAHRVTVQMPTSPKTFKEDLKRLQEQADPGVKVETRKYNPHLMHGDHHDVTLVRWLDAPPGEDEDDG
jgi:hypothetical protein